MTTNYPEPTMEQPNSETLTQWLLEDSGGLATDGCSIGDAECCAHGHPSWLSRLGFLPMKPLELAKMQSLSPTVYQVEEVYGVYADAFVSNDSGALLFASFWGRDTSIAELLARLSLPVSEGGISNLNLVDSDDSSSHWNLSIGSVDRLQKLTGRMPKAGLFKDMTQTWLYDRQLVEPCAGKRKAMRIYQAGEVQNEWERIWTVLKEYSPLPLLEAWQEPVVDAVRRLGWVSFHTGVQVHVLALNLEVQAFQSEMERMIQAGILSLPDPLLEKSAVAALNSSRVESEPPQRK